MARANIEQATFAPFGTATAESIKAAAFTTDRVNSRQTRCGAGWPRRFRFRLGSCAVDVEHHLIFLNHTAPIGRDVARQEGAKHGDSSPLEGIIVADWGVKGSPKWGVRAGPFGPARG
ncbi:MAG: hypothetical protein M3R06_02155, partial [Chloroflexota bacterium]|nr:hypothetical protein [Chloroflexota bacterium]